MRLKKKLLIDPPSGWMYGFPDYWIQEDHGSMEDFLRLKKYPEKDIQFALEHMRILGDEPSKKEE